ncbi:MAG: Hpt domain-containing protein [Desulfovibrionaceae bacterium]|nr:Hpt domain-containing protein [Desulfovibrionaceae bacterium]
MSRYLQFLGSPQKGFLMTIQELYASIDGNYESAKRILAMDKLIQKFIVRLLTDKSFDRLQNANGDPKELFESTHALKGVCANLGLDKLSAMASEISEEYRPGKSRTMSDDEVNARLAAFSEKYKQTIDEIKKFSEQ